MPFVLRASVRLGLAGLFLLGANDALQNAFAEGDTRSLSFHHLHTDETITITYKRDGRYDDAALKKLDWFMRDWRKEQSVKMDPHLFDLLWEANREVGGTQPIQIICGYRSPGTNAMLRARSSGVAQNSQHTNGQAIDFYIPGVPLEKVRNVGLRLQRGGVGFYPTSGSPFVHLDTGSIRHWPRMTHDQLAKVFPDGRTVHIPSDGQPLAGYQLALADVERRGSHPSNVSLAAAREAGVITTASLDTPAAQTPGKGLLEGLFGGFLKGGADQEQDEAEAAQPAAKPRPAAKPVVVASAIPVVAPKPADPAVPLPSARPKIITVAAVANPAAMPAATPAPSMFDTRVSWNGSVDTQPLPAPARRAPFEVASAGPVTTASMPDAALSYAAADSEPAPTPRARPMGAQLPKLPRQGIIRSAAAATLPPEAAKTVTMAFGQRTDSPWLRAAVLTPSVSGFMTMTRMGAVDPRPLGELLHKPAQAVLMSFSADPHLGMVAERFSGAAVVFVTTANFTAQTTASLR